MNVAIDDLQTNLSAIVRMVKSGKTVSLIEHGKEIAQMVPVQSSQAEALQELAKLSETAVIHDVLSPIDTAWEAT